MKHPNREEWVPFLFGEAEPEAKKQLAEHLSACRECAEELGNWRKSLHRLDAWKTPRHKRRGMPALTPVFNFAAAALLVLGLGFGLGRWFSNSADAGQLRAAALGPNRSDAGSHHGPYTSACAAEIKQVRCARVARRDCAPARVCRARALA